MRVIDADSSRYDAAPLHSFASASVGTRVRSWPTLSQAANDAGVTTTTFRAWVRSGEVERRFVEGVWRFSPSTVRARARRHWSESRFRRARVPRWLKDERAAAASEAARCAAPVSIREGEAS